MFKLPVIVILFSSRSSICGATNQHKYEKQQRTIHRSKFGLITKLKTNELMEETTTTTTLVYAKPSLIYIGFSGI
jgi:hypothetical protein